MHTATNKGFYLARLARIASCTLSGTRTIHACEYIAGPITQQLATLPVHSAACSKGHLIGYLGDSTLYVEVVLVCSLCLMKG